MSEPVRQPDPRLADLVEDIRVSLWDGSETAKVGETALDKLAVELAAREQQLQNANLRAAQQEARAQFAEQQLQDTRTENAKLREGLEEIALFRDGKLVDRQAHILRERARITLADHVTRGAFRAGLVDEIEELWRDYCNGDLSIGALAQELGEALASVSVPPQDTND